MVNTSRLLKAGGITIFQELAAVFRQVWETCVIAAIRDGPLLFQTSKARVNAGNAGASMNLTPLRTRHGLFKGLVGQNYTSFTALPEAKAAGLYSEEVNSRLHPGTQSPK